MRTSIIKLEKILKDKFMLSCGHDFYHLQRVKALALNIQKKEGGDETVIAISALLHDIHRIIEHETKHFCSPKKSLPEVKKVFRQIEYI